MAKRRLLLKENQLDVESAGINGWSTTNYGSSTILLTDTNGNVTYSFSSGSAVSISTNAFLKVTLLTVNVFSIVSSGSPSGGVFQIEANGDNTFYGLQNTFIETSGSRIVTSFTGTSYTNDQVALLSPIFFTTAGKLVIRLPQKNNYTTFGTTPFTCTNGSLMLKFTIFNNN